MKTPETDAVKFTTYSTRHEQYIEAVLVDFARAQERRIAELQSIIRGKTFVTESEPKRMSTVQILREVEDTLIEIGWHKDRGVLKRVSDCLDEVGRIPEAQ